MAYLAHPAALPAAATPPACTIVHPAGYAAPGMAM